MGIGKLDAWHLRIEYSRVYIQPPKSFCQAMYLRWRGYRPHWIGELWCKPSKRWKAENK